MSLGQELAPHLPFLRRYARALVGSQKEGDAYVRATLEAIVAAPKDFPRDIEPRLGLYRIFQEIWRSSAGSTAVTGQRDVSDINAGVIAQRRLTQIAPISRQALLLTALEGFTVEDTAFLIERDKTEVDILVAEALAEIERQTHADVLIIEDEPIIAMDLETIVRGLGHGVTGVATTRTEAVRMALERRPGLILADIQLADDSSGIDAVKDILSHFEVPVIFITAFPERLLTGARVEPTFLITKPFARKTVKAAIAQALFFDNATIPMDEVVSSADEPRPTGPTGGVQSAARSIPTFELEPTVSPLRTEVIGLTLRRAPSEPVFAPVGLDAMNHLRATLRRTADAIDESLEGRNDAGPIRRKLVEIASELSEPLSQESSLSIGVSSNGLTRMLPALAETMMDLPLAEIRGFAADLQDFAQNFPIYRRFRIEAENEPPLTSDARSAVIALAQDLVSAGEAVDPVIKQALTNAVAASGIDGGSPVADHALLTMVADAVRSLARWARDMLFDIGAGARKVLVSALSALVVGLPAGWALSILKVQHPAMYAGALAMLILFRDATKGGESDKKD